MKRIFRRGRYANVTSTLALILALGGTSYAAVALPKNSVGSKQIKSNAVGSSEVKNRSLLSKDFKAGQLPAGPKGATGAAGPAGPIGPKGDTGAAGAAGQSATKLFAAGDADGSLQRSSGGVTVNKVNTGLYRVTFPQSVERCVAVASIGASSDGNNTQSGGAAAAVNAQLGTGVTTVRTSNGTATEDKPWAIAVFC